MRVVFVDRFGANAIWAVVSPASRALFRDGHEVVWLRMKQGDRRESLEPPDGVEIVDLEVCSSAEKLGFIKQLAHFRKLFSQYLKQHPCDVVHTHFAVPGMVARWVATRAGCKVVSTQHEMFGSMNFLLRAGVRLSERYTDVITYVSKTVATSYGENDVAVLEVSQRVVPDRIVVYNSIDFSEVEKAVQASGERDENKVICVGRMVPEKGQASLLEAWSGVLQSRPVMQLHFIGSGPDEGKLKRRADELEVTQSVYFHGWLSKPEALRQMATAGLVVQPSEHEGFGLTVMEALATGSPLLASDIAVFREVIGAQRGKVEFFPVGEVKLLTERIVSMLGKNHLELGREHTMAPLRQRFSDVENAASYLSIYATLCDQ